MSQTNIFFFFAIQKKKTKKILKFTDDSVEELRDVVKRKAEDNTWQCDEKVGPLVSVLEDAIGFQKKIFFFVFLFYFCVFFVFFVFFFFVFI